MINSILIDLRIIESFSFPVQNLNFWILMHGPSIIFKRFLFLAVIFYNKNFYILISIFFPDRSQAFDQIICVIFIRNNNRYLRCLLHRIFCPVHSRILRRNNFCFNSHSSVMRSYRFCTCIHNIGFILCTVSCRSLACPPVIKYSRYMPDLIGIFNTPEHKIIVLCTIVLTIQLSCHLI